MKNRLLNLMVSIATSEAYSPSAIYRTIKWNPAEVLTERRKAVIRKKYIKAATWLATVSLFALLLGGISALNQKPSDVLLEKAKPVQEIIVPKGFPVYHPAKEYLSEEEFEEITPRPSEWLGC